MTANRHDSNSHHSQSKAVVVVLGPPNDTLIGSLETVGLAPVAQDGEVVIWAKPFPSPPVKPVPATEPPIGNGPAGLLLTIADAASVLGIGRSTLYELIGRGELEVVHVGRSARVPTEALRALVERLRADQAPQRWPRATG